MGSFFMPTRIISGMNCVADNTEIFKSLGKKAMIVCGKHSASVSGALEDTCRVLDNNFQEYVIFNEISTNPTIDMVYRGAKLAREEDVDFIIAIGGGSPMDSAKSIAVLAKENVLREDIFKGGFKSALPMIHIPITAGTGSEVTPYAILTNDKVRSKMTMSSPVMFPKYAFLDGKYMESLPYDITVNTAVDALSHSVEGMLSKKSTAFSDSMAKESIAMISRHFDDLLSKRFDLKLRQELLEASALAGMVISQTGTTVVHTMGYSFTYFKGTAHGRANGLLLGEFLKLGEVDNKERLSDILKAMNMSSCDEFSKFLKDLLKPVEILTGDEVKKYTEITMGLAAKKLNGCMILAAEKDIAHMYEKVGK